MRLLVDVGGSRLKWALARGRALEPMKALPWRERGLSATLDEAWSALAAPASVWVADVRGEEALAPLSAWTAQHWGLAPRRVAVAAQAAGVRNGYDHPGQLGVDRWLALVAAHALGRGAVCVVDAGTALTADALSAEGHHLGGVIAPGLELMREALGARTRASSLSDTGAREVFGRCTEDGISAGCALALAGLVERCLAEARGRLGPATRCILTGGAAPQLAPLLTETVEQVPDLVLRGLALVTDDA